jgi:hypothetical protein
MIFFKGAPGFDPGVLALPAGEALMLMSLASGLRRFASYG